MSIKTWNPKHCGVVGVNHLETSWGVALKDLWQQISAGKNFYMKEINKQNRIEK